MAPFEGEPGVVGQSKPVVYSRSFNHLEKNNMRSTVSPSVLTAVLIGSSALAAAEEIQAGFFENMGG